MIFKFSNYIDNIDKNITRFCSCGAASPVGNHPPGPAAFRLQGATSKDFDFASHEFCNPLRVAQSSSLN